MKQYIGIDINEKVDKYKHNTDWFKYNKKMNDYFRKNKANEEFKKDSLIDENKTNVTKNKVEEKENIK